VAVQPDGKIVAAGQAGGQVAVTRYDSDGALDATFGGDGRVTFDFDGSAAEGRGVAVQPDGKIVVAGNTDFQRFAVARLNGDGTLDTTFSGDGLATTNFTSGWDGAYAVAIQDNHKIVAGGSASPGIGSAFALARYLPDGTLDATFGGDGKVKTRFGHLTGTAWDLAIQANGKIVAVGESSAGGGFALVRYLGSGSLDQRFSGDGKTITRFKLGGGARSVALQADGRIVVSGTGGDIFGPFAVARYTDRGRLDDTFGGDGRVTVNTGGGEESADGVALQANGRIVAVGYAGIPHEGGDTGKGGFRVVRLRANGVLDTSFGGDGKVRTLFPAGMALGVGVALQADGRIVAVGWAGNRFALARYVA
jgi:uncharacterized delta-60 repeat protein